MTDLFPTSFFDPFDRTYLEVTQQMKAIADELQPADKKWLTTLIDQFQIERDGWERKQELKLYRASCLRLRLDLLRLVAGAYLHVAYDLPRVVANNWPGRGAWKDSPSELRGEGLYFDLSPVFPRVLTKVARDRRVAGFASYLLRFLPASALQVAGHWVMHLRTAAWIHARRLAEEPLKRSYYESMMLEAMAGALQHVSNNRPWSVGLLHPPNPASARTPQVAAVAVSITDLDHAWIGTAATSAILLSAGGVVFWKLQRERELTHFVNDFGSRVFDYVNAAFAHGDGIFRYMRERAARDGIRSNL